MSLLLLLNAAGRIAVTETADRAVFSAQVRPPPVVATLLVTESADKLTATGFNKPPPVVATLHAQEKSDGADFVAINYGGPALVFAWVPDYGAEKSVSFTVQRINFGDGYSQRVSSGINNQVGSWTATFSNRTIQVANAIEEFLEEHAGSRYFLWPLPSDPSNNSRRIKVVCEEYKRSCTGFERDTISMTLRRVYDT